MDGHVVQGELGGGAGGGGRPHGPLPRGGGQALRPHPHAHCKSSICSFLKQYPLYDDMNYKEKLEGVHLRLGIYE